MWFDCAICKGRLYSGKRDYASEVFTASHICGHCWENETIKTKLTQMFSIYNSMEKLPYWWKTLFKPDIEQIIIENIARKRSEQRKLEREQNRRLSFAQSKVS